MRGLCRQIVPVLLLLLLTGAPVVAQVEGGTSNCAVPQLTMGIPPDYSRIELDSGKQPEEQYRNRMCASLVVGSPYQLLSWLETGEIQGAILSDFAISVMKSDSPESFHNEFYVLPLNMFAGIPRVERRLLLTDGMGAPVQEPYVRLDEFFNAMRTSRQKRGILLPSHLSPALPYLIRSAIDWAARQDLSESAREQFYEALLAAIHLGTPIENGGHGAPEYELQFFDRLLPLRTSPPLSQANELRPNLTISLSLADHFVVRRHVLVTSESISELLMSVYEKSKARPQVIAPQEGALFANTRLEEKKIGAGLTHFLESNYRRLTTGGIARRHFRFTIPELWEMLDTIDQGKPESTRDVALILTGGGVKAAYQTRMIDFLYDGAWLQNSTSAPVNPRTRRVNYIIGTSGGALLGVFVAAMDDSFDRNRRASENGSLTAILWRTPGPGLSSFDVFPFLDTMRYASFVLALLVMYATASFIVNVWRTRYPQVATMATDDQSFLLRRSRVMRESWLWVALLLIAPATIVYISQRFDGESVPREVGLFYALIAMLVSYSELRLSPLKPLDWRRVRIGWLTAILLVLAASLIAVAILHPHFFADQGATTAFDLEAYMCLIGFVLLTYAIHRFFKTQNEYFSVEPLSHLIRAFATVVGILLLAYLIVWFSVWMNITSMLEMDGGFWLNLISSTALITACFLWLGRSRSQHKDHSWAQKTVGYLFSEFPSRALIGSQRRLMRFSLLMALAWMWWNILVAPALYGNDEAHAYLDTSFRMFSAVRDQGKRSSRTPDLSYGTEFPLAVPLVLTATSLERNQERYFLFVSGGIDSADASLPPQAWFNVARDPRWVVVRQPRDRELQSAAFASGSPFPVFSAHYVRLRIHPAQEKFVDGGFAHNRPIEAAAVLGAKKVLVINSSPLDSPITHECTVFNVRLGEMMCNLPKLLPYLWERSQVEDMKMTRDLVVASIYPTASSAIWPSLTDFRGRTVIDLVTAAERDQFSRSGMIDSWGPPKSHSQVNLGYDSDAITATIMLDVRAQ